MAISLIGSTITIDSGTASGTATGGTTNTLTGSGFGSWAGRIVWITGGTGAGQSRFIRSATATTLTVEQNWTTPPTSGSTFSIGYTWADIDTAIAGVTASSPNFYLVPYSLSLSAGGFIGSINEHVRFTVSIPAITSVSNSLWQQGRLFSSGVAANGGTVEFAYSTGGGFHYQSLLGRVRWYRTLIAALPVGNGNYVINNAASGDGLDFRDCYINNIYIVGRNVDRFERCTQNTRPIWPKSAVAPVLIDNSYIENSFIINGDNGAGADNHYFGLSFQGIPQDGIFSKPYWVWSTTTKEGTYFWDGETQEYATTADATLFYNDPPMPSGAGFHTGKTVALTTKNVDGTALGGVTIGLWDASGNAAWFEGVDSATGRPVNSLTITTNSSGIYLNPWAAVAGKSGLVVAERVKQIGTTRNAIVTSYGPWVLRARKFGYFEAGGPRNFSNSSTETIIQSADAKQTADGTAVTGISINYSTSTITLTSNNTIENLNNYLKLSLRQNIIQNDFTSYSGSAFNMGSGLLTGLEFLSMNSVFDEIIGTGVFTASAAFNNIKVTGNINQNTPTNLSGVIHDGILTYNTNTNTTITITNCTLGTVRNIGTGIITINRINSTIANYTDAEINFIDSTISVIGADTVTFHPTANNRDLNINASGSFSGSYAFKYGAIINGTTMSGTLYLRCVSGGIPFNVDKAIVLGDNLVDLGTTAQLASISAKIELAAKETSVQSVKSNTDKIATLTEDVSGLRFTTKALEQAPSGGGGSGLTLAQIEASTVLAKEATILQSEVDIIAEINANEVKIDGIKAKTDTLVNTDLSLVAKTTELTSAKNEIITEVNANEVKIDTAITKIDTKPTLVQIEGSTILSKEATLLQSEADIIAEVNANEVKIDAVKTKVDTLENADFTATNAKIDSKPSLAQIEGSTVIAKEATSQTINTKVQTLSNYNDTTAQGKLDAIKAKTDTLVNTDISTLSKKADTDLLLKSADYVAPDNTKIAQIKTKVDTLENYDDTILEGKVDAIKAKTDTLVNTDLTVTNAKIDALGNPLQENDYIAPDNASIAKIKTNTDLIPATL